MPDMAMPHPASVTAWHRAQDSIICSLASGQRLLCDMLTRVSPQILPHTAVLCRYRLCQVCAVCI